MTRTSPREIGTSRPKSRRSIIRASFPSPQRYPVEGTGDGPGNHNLLWVKPLSHGRKATAA